MKKTSLKYSSKTKKQTNKWMEKHILFLNNKTQHSKDISSLQLIY